MLPLMYRKRLFMGFLRFPISFIYFYLWVFHNQKSFEITLLKNY